MNLNLVVFLILSTIWGSTWLVIRIGLADLPPFTFAGLRFVIASIPLVALVIARRVSLPRDKGSWALMLWTGFLTITMNYALIFWAEQHISSGLSAILYSTMPLWGQVFAHWRIPDERMTSARLTGVLIGIAGVFVIFSQELRVEGAVGTLGTLAVLVAAAMTAYANVEIKKSGRHISSLVMSAVQITFGFIPLLAVGLPLEGNPLNFHWTTRAVLSLIYLAVVGSSIAFGLYYWLIHRIPVTRIQLIPLLSTLLAVLLGALVLNEAVTWRTAVGAVAILGGLVIAVRAKPIPALALK